MLVIVQWKQRDLGRKSYILSTFGSLFDNVGLKIRNLVCRSTFSSWKAWKITKSTIHNAKSTIFDPTNDIFDATKDRFLMQRTPFWSNERQFDAMKAFYDATNTKSAVFDARNAILMQGKLFLMQLMIFWYNKRPFRCNERHFKTMNVILDAKNADLMPNRHLWRNKHKEHHFWRK